MNALTLAYSVILLVQLSDGQEQSCSKFDYDKRMLEILVRMEADIKQRDEKLNNLQEQLTETISEVQELKKALQSQKDLNTDLSDQNEKLDAQLNHSRDAEIKTTFYFFMHTPSSKHLNGKMFFTNRTFSNDTWYDASTGVLTMKEDGLYYLSYTFVTMSDTVSSLCDLYWNNAKTVFIRGKGRYQSSTASMFKVLEKGDTLDIRCFQNYSFVDKGRGTIFTGAMIRPAP